MTTAAESEQHTSADAQRPTNGAAPGGASAGLAPFPGIDSADGGLALFPGIDPADAGLCIGGVCRLPAAKS